MVTGLRPHKLVGTVNVGSTPVWAAASPDGTTVYVTNYASNSVSVIRTADNSVVNTISIPAGEPYGDAVSPDGHWLYMASGSVATVVDTGIWRLGDLCGTVPIFDCRG